MKFRKKPVIIEAVQYEGVLTPEITDFAREHLVINLEPLSLWIETLEGTMVVSKGDWIIKGVKGEFYPCKPDIFEASYEKVEE